MSTKLPHPAVDLSFMQSRNPHGTGIDYWTVEPSGIYTADCEKGRALAEEFLTYVGKHPTNGNATLLGPIVQSMMDRAGERGRLSGVEIAFLSGVMGHAMATSVALRRLAA